MAHCACKLPPALPTFASSYLNTKPRKRWIYFQAEKVSMPMTISTKMSSKLWLSLMTLSLPEYELSITQPLITISMRVCMSHLKKWDFGNSVSAPEWREQLLSNKQGQTSACQSGKTKDLSISLTLESSVQISRPQSSSVPCSHITSSDTTPTSSKTPKGGSTLSYSVISIMQGGYIVWLSALPSFSLPSCHPYQFLFHHLYFSPNCSLFLDASSTRLQMSKERARVGQNSDSALFQFITWNFNWIGHVSQDAGMKFKLKWQEEEFIGLQTVIKERDFSNPT